MERSTISDIAICADYPNLRVVAELPMGTGAWLLAATSIVRKQYRRPRRAPSPRLMSATGGVLIHRAAGKDGTGIAVALVLSAIGVSRAAVVKDFLESRKRVNPDVVTATRMLLESKLGLMVGSSVSPM